MVKSLLDVNAGDEVTIVKYNDGGFKKTFIRYGIR